MSRALLLSLLLLAITPFGCDGQLSGGVREEDPELTADGDPDPGPGERTIFAVASHAVGATIKACNVQSGLNVRSGPSTGYMVLRSVSKGTQGKVLARDGDWYKWSPEGTVGWSHGQYLCAASPAPTPEPSPTPEPTPAPGGGFGVSRDGIINAAAAFVKFSYWWGGGRLKVGSKEYGKCYSSTSSGHSGPYGADCSGYAAKVWQLPEAMPFDVNKHPFSTYNFYNERKHWSSISRGDAKRADAMVYNSGGSGHIFIYESGNVWGQAWTYEARGCSYGIVHNTRTISSSYVARRRNGV